MNDLAKKRDAIHPNHRLERTWMGATRPFADASLAHRLIQTLQEIVMPMQVPVWEALSKDFLKTDFMRSAFLLYGHFSPQQWINVMASHAYSLVHLAQGLHTLGLETLVCALEKETGAVVLPKKPTYTLLSILPTRPGSLPDDVCHRVLMEFQTKLPKSRDALQRFLGFVIGGKCYASRGKTFPAQAFLDRHGEMKTEDLVEALDREGYTLDALMRDLRAFGGFEAGDAANVLAKALNAPVVAVAVVAPSLPSPPSSGKASKARFVPDTDPPTVLGVGAFGVVVRMRDTRKGNVLVAVKRLKATDDDAANTAIEEASAIMALRHPNIVAMAALPVMQDGQICIVTEYCDAGDLNAFMEQHPGFAGRDGAMAQLAMTVCYLHGKQVIHRDIKPGNVLVHNAASPCFKLSDFGLARLLDDASQAQTLAGTPFFKAPEIGNGPYGPAVDVFSLGVLFMVMAVWKRDVDVFQALLPPYTLPAALALSNKAQLDACVLTAVQGHRDMTILIQGMLMARPDERSSIGAVCSELGCA